MKLITAEDSEAKSEDIVQANLRELEQLFPDAFSEGNLDFDVLKQLVGGAVDEREEKYGLNWNGKRQARKLALTQSSGTLRPVPDDSVDWETTRNLMIEGDNLEVLKLLQKSYARKVKLVYVDPPYNTGSDLVYPDNFRDPLRSYLELTGQAESGIRLSTNTEASGRFHTSWLNMIYPRLRLARSLLRQDGVILISIDDHEIDDLTLVCNEIFGEENFVASLVWEKGRKNDAKLFSVGHEYVVVYARSLSYLRETKTVWREEKPGAREIWEKYVELRVAHGSDDQAIEADLSAWFASLPKSHPSKKWSRYKRVDTNGPWRDRDISWPGGGGPRYDVIHPVTGLPCKVPERGWIYAEPETMQRHIDAGLVEFRGDHSEPPFRKWHIRVVPTTIESDEPLAGDEGAEDEFASQVRGSYFYKQSQVSVRELRGLMGAKVFDNPKDHEELARLIDYCTAGDREAIVFDFFAGSGSTGQAVMELNADDGGTRRFILVQLPEPLDPENREQRAAAIYCDEIGRPRNIAELAKERLRRVGENLRPRAGSKATDLGFRVFRLDSSNLQTWEPERDDLPMSLEHAVEHVKAQRSDSDLLYELLLKLGLDLVSPIESKELAAKRVDSVGGGVLLVCLADVVSREDVEPLALGIGDWHSELAPATEATCIFRDSAFADDVAKTNLAAILQQHGLTNVRSL